MLIMGQVSPKCGPSNIHPAAGQKKHSVDRSRCKGNAATVSSLTLTESGNHLLCLLIYFNGRHPRHFQGSATSYPSSLHKEAHNKALSLLNVASEPSHPAVWCEWSGLWKSYNSYNLCSCSTIYLPFQRPACKSLTTHTVLYLLLYLFSLTV